MGFRTFARRTALALALAVATIACKTSDSVTGPVPVAAVTLTAAPSLIVGQATTVAVALTDASGKVLTGRAITWSTSAPLVASVSPAGEVTAINAGTARITATSEGKEGSLDLTVLPRSALVDSIHLDVTSFTLAIDETRQLVATPVDANGQPVHGVAIGWSAAGGSVVATVSGTGLVTAREMGTMTISASVDGKLTQAIVTVISNASHDIVFDRWATHGGIERPFLHRLDARSLDAVPVGILAGTISSDAAPSPDGQRIAFVCDNGGPAICVANRDGSGVSLLAAFGGSSKLLGDQPAWSPDGSKIAFRGWMPGATPGLFNPTDIWVVNADGSEPTRLTAADSAVDYYEAPAWAPRAGGVVDRIAFSHGTRGADGYARGNIESIRVDGADLRAVTSATDYVDSQPSWSPDGANIAFVRTGGSVGGDIWIASANGGNERSLFAASTEPAGAQRAPAWSPDGGEIAFVSNHEIIANYYAWQVYTVRADGTRMVRRTDDRAEKDNPAWIKRN